MLSFLKATAFNTLIKTYQICTHENMTMQAKYALIWVCNHCSCRCYSTMRCVTSAVKETATEARINTTRVNTAKTPVAAALNIPVCYQPHSGPARISPEWSTSLYCILLSCQKHLWSSSNVSTPDALISISDCAAWTNHKSTVVWESLWWWHIYWSLKMI